MPRASINIAIGAHVAGIFREERVKRDLSLRLLAKNSGVTRQTIGYIEKEVQSPSLDTMLKIAFALGMNLSEILARAENQAATKTGLHAKP